MKHMRRSSLVWMALGGALLAGCGGLQDVWEGPGAQSFRPSSIAVLPPIVGSFDESREPAQEVVTNALKKSARYTQVLGPDEVNGPLAASKEAREALTSYLSGIETSGVSDKGAAAILAQALKADALMVVKVTSWEYARSEGDKVAKVALGLRLIDSKQGAIVWKARHTNTTSYMFFKPSLKDLAADLSEDMIKHIP
jgi:hypothetical protein